jgi:methylmalonyl-CoA epimerase
MYIPDFPLDHVAIAVSSLDPYLLKNTETISEQGVIVGFINNLEIIAPISSEGPLVRFLSKHGEGSIHHVGLRVKEIEKVIDELLEKGVEMIDKRPKIGARQKKIAFIHPRSTGGTLIELCE